MTGRTSSSISNIAASEKLTWWFDHHESAFLSSQDEAHFRHDRSGQKFHDASYKSCTKFIAHVTRTVFDCPMPDLDDLIHWADIIDGAQFPDAKTAVELKEPAMRLMLVIEASHSPRLIHKIINEIQHKSLSDVINDPEIHSTFEKLYAHHFESIEIMRRVTKCTNRVIEFDVSDHDLDGYNKFIPYYLFPESVYSVGVSQSPVACEGFGRDQSMDQARTSAEPCKTLRTIWRRRACRRCSDLFQAERTG